MRGIGTRFVYVLRSDVEPERHYVGVTSNVDDRLDWHNAGPSGHTSEDETEDTPLLPDHICSNEEERHVWRAEVLAFIRDHVEAGETYRLALFDLEFGELIPRAPEWLIQDQYEERSRVGFALDRITRAVDGLCGVTGRKMANCDASEADLKGPEDRNESVSKHPSRYR